MDRLSSTVEKPLCRSAVWRANNHDKALARERRYREANKEHIRAYNAKWCKDNAARHCDHVKRWMRKKKILEGRLVHLTTPHKPTNDELLAIMEQEGKYLRGKHVCLDCERILSKDAVSSTNPHLCKNCLQFRNRGTIKP